MTCFYDREGKPISRCEWQNYLIDLDYKIVKKDTYGPFFVSTVWLGLDHSFSWLPADQIVNPLIFETMIFCSDGSNELGDYQERYSTEEEALEGHEKACQLAAQQENNV